MPLILEQEFGNDSIKSPDFIREGAQPALKVFNVNIFVKLPALEPVFAGMDKTYRGTKKVN